MDQKKEKNKSKRKAFFARDSESAKKSHQMY